jgi:ankyrin repeat protein
MGGLMQLVAFAIERMSEFDQYCTDESPNAVFARAAYFGDFDKVKEMFTVADHSYGKYFCFRYAARNGHVDIVCYLLQMCKALDPAVDDNFAIVNAARYGHHSVVQTLLRLPSVDPSAQNNEALREAVMFGHFNVVRCLLPHPKVDVMVGYETVAFRVITPENSMLVLPILLCSRKVLSRALSGLDSSRIHRRTITLYQREIQSKHLCRHILERMMQSRRLGDVADLVLSFYGWDGFI